MYDLIIVGGGPAGSASGRIAGLQNLKTLLLDKQTFPRYKPCGGAFSEQAMSYLDFSIPDYLKEREIYGARVHFSRQVVEQSTPNRIGILTTRSALDHFLLQKAEETGIDVKLGEKVLNISEESDYVEVRTPNSSWKSKFVIIAEGAKGRLKYRVRTKDAKDEFGIAVVTEIPEENKNIDNFINQAVEIHFGVTPFGYGWIFPHEKYFSVGIGGMAKLMPRPQDTMRKFLTDQGFDTNYKLKTHLIPSGGIKRRLFTRRIVLCGDSAGFTDPFTGEGIAYAIRSGQIAAKTIAEIVRSDPNSNRLSEYEQLCQKEFGRHLKSSLRLTKILHRYPKLFSRLATQNEQVRTKFLDIQSFCGDYRQYFKWLFPRIPLMLLRSGRFHRN